MGIIFGIRGEAERLVGEDDLRKISRLTNHLAPDGTFLLAVGNVGLGCQPFYTHERSRLEAQPLADKRGNMLLWDGRLDNFCELANVLGLPDNTTPDPEIVLAAWGYWGESCFSKLVGEWSLVLWSRPDASLYLARDHAGTRTLYYELHGENISWSSTLLSLVSRSKRGDLSEEFMARYLCSAPIGSYTPYRGIRAVPAGHLVRIRERSADIRRHWDAHRMSPPACKTDTEYEELFCDLFRQAVDRRSGKGAPVLAQLSGGMDSGAIVCMSDELRGRAGKAHMEFVDTISYFDASEPNWDERPFVTIVESRRGKAGIHIDLNESKPSGQLDLAKEAAFSVWPEDWQTSSVQPEAEHGFRTVLSGLGGDELLGGIPTSLPELGDLLYRHRYFRLAKRSLAWCIADRTALIQRLREVVSYRYSVYQPDALSPSAIPPWVSEGCRKALSCSAEQQHLYWHRQEMPPSFVSFLKAWSVLLENLPRHKASDRQKTEYRFPYLDRDLVAFLAHVPRDQLVRPGRRRSLMRRALKQIMPAEVLERKRKAFIIGRPVRTIRQNQLQIRSLFERSVAEESGYIDRSRLLPALEDFQASTRTGTLRSLTRAISLEVWLRALQGSE